MRLSTKGRYGLRLMMELAKHYGKGPTLLKDIAQNQDISEKYLWQLINPLKIAKLINSSRGSHGGYMLAKHPSEINLDDIISVLEGKPSLVECIDNPSICERSAKCPARDIWSEVSSKISDLLRSITLEDMLDRQKAKDQGLKLKVKD
ncbi:MAG: RrF2 family transcriptional regulator [Candidatus Poribacteria bacterium]